MAEPIADVSVPIWLGFSVSRWDKSTLEKAVHLPSTLLLLSLLKSNNFREHYWQWRSFEEDSAPGNCHRVFFCHRIFLCNLVDLYFSKVYQSINTSEVQWEDTAANTALWMHQRLFRTLCLNKYYNERNVLKVISLLWGWVEGEEVLSQCSPCLRKLSLNFDLRPVVILRLYHLKWVKSKCISYVHDSCYFWRFSKSLCTTQLTLTWLMCTC